MAGPTDAFAISLLTDLLHHYSPSTEEEQAARCLVSAMTALGFQADCDAVGNAVGHIGSGPRQVVLLGHIDTVPGKIPVRREGDLLYGRGAVDAKGPLACFVMAAHAAAESGLRLTVIGAVQEETASSAGAVFAADRYHPDYAIIGEPSRWDRITIGYKGSLAVSYSLERPASHSAGQNSTVVEEAVTFWLQVQAWAQAYNEGKSGSFAQLGASLRHIGCSGDGLRETVEMMVGLRLPLGFDRDNAVEALRMWQGTAKLHIVSDLPAFRAGKSNLLTAAFLHSIRTEGGAPAFVTKTGTSDMNVVGPRWQCPIVAYGPGDSALDHTPDEHIDINEYLLAIRVLSRALHRLANQPLGVWD